MRDSIGAQLQGNWIGRKGPVAPPRLPDLIPSDLLWGYAKDKVHAPKPKAICQLKLKIENACESIPVEKLQSVRDPVLQRCVKYYNAVGGHFEE